MTTQTHEPAVGPDSAPKTDPLTDHEYDGIQEYDNPMPRWWVWIYWGTFYFAICYVLWMHVFMKGTTVVEAYDEEMQVAREAAAQRDLGTVSEQSLGKLTKNAAVMADARAMFQKRCVQCHGPKGAGLIGPNLTDDYWIHGRGRLMDIYRVVNGGVASKGMPEWGKVLAPIEIAKLAAYVGTIRGTHLEGKAPEGTLVAPPAAPAGK